MLPNKCGNPAVAVFVHGDGPQNRWHSDGYLPLMNSLLSDCIGVFSWDKPGVGDSGGNWLKQTMDDRAILANAVLVYLRALPELSNNRIGYLGFSQAGWVVPKAASITRPDFSVLIGPAVNWQQQGMFLTHTRLKLAGLESEEIEIKAEQIRQRDHSLFRNEGDISNTVKADGMDPDRFEFVRLNYDADATKAIQTMRGPVLALWGANDMNVDAHKNAQQYRQLLKPDPTNKVANRVVIVPNATHSLLKARWFNYQTLDQWPLSSQLLIATMGRRAYASGVLASIAAWINTPATPN